MLLEGKIVLVTGASAGIDRAAAIGAARHGADLAINYVSDETGADSCVAEIEALGRRAFALKNAVAERATAIDSLRGPWRAGPIVFLASDLAAYVTGAVLLLDGGMFVNLQ